MVKVGTTGDPGFCQTCFPVAASNAVTMPVMPIANSRPFENTGVDFGPAPCRAAPLCIVNEVGYPVFQSTAPVAASSALMTSSPPCRENM